MKFEEAYRYFLRYPKMYLAIFSTRSVVPMTYAWKKKVEIALEKRKKEHNELEGK